MLDLTRLESGALSPQRGWYSLAEIVNRVLQRFGPDLADRPLTLQVPEDLPLLPVDYVQIEQVVWNVLQNALKYSPPGSPLVITAELAGTVVALRISDHGPGVPVEERERVFAKFYRYQHPDQARVPGSGVGLTICKGLVEAHGGQIAFSEHHGGGALVEIQLSLQIDPAIPSGKEQR
jgi:two-component system sensor histidine kinase KdpD